MSKELVISVGVPYSGRTTWLNKNYNVEGTVIIEEDKFEGLMKDGKVQEKNFFLSNEWVTSQVQQLMESETPCPRIVVSFYQSRPDHWRGVLELVIKHEYSLTLVYPKNGYLYYLSNKFGRNQEQVDWIKTATMSRFPKKVKDKKKVKTEEEEERENYYTYDNIVTEYMSANAFIIQYRAQCGTDPKKWLETITQYYKPVITRITQERTRREAEVQKQIEIKAKEESAKIAIEARKEAKALAQAQAQAKLEVLVETCNLVETSNLVETFQVVEAS
jgi:hypothetical protein